MEPAPIAGMFIGQQGDASTVRHLNGEMLTEWSYKILVDGVDKPEDFGAVDNFSPGMTLTRDSGTEAVRTVSVVYTSNKGVPMLLAEKTIGIAGSGGETENENGDDENEEDSFEDKYTFNEMKDWQAFLDEVNALPKGMGREIHLWVWMTVLFMLMIGSTGYLTVTRR